jgi:hypothetical protein
MEFPGDVVPKFLMQISKERLMTASNSKAGEDELAVSFNRLLEEHYAAIFIQTAYHFMVSL